VLGAMLKMQAENPPAEDEVLAFLVPKTTGPCRTGQYAPYYERTFSDLGIDNVAIMNLNSDNGYMELGPMFNKLAWYALVLGDYFKDMELAVRILAKDRVSAMAEFMDIWAGVVQMLSDDITQLYEHLEHVALPRLQAIPRDGDAEELAKVIVVGEIYVRRDDHSVSELIDHLVENKIYPKVTGITEWINYCDYSQEKIAAKALDKLPWYKRPTAPQFGRWAGMKVEQAFMRAIEERVDQVLRPSGLTVKFPHDMREIFKGVDEFTSMDFETEATVSSLTASKAMQQGYDGIIAIAPFACLPGRLIKAMLEPYSRQRALPMMTVEADGLRFPPNVISRLEIFMLNVMRRKAGDGDLFQRLTAPPVQEQTPGAEETPS
jgi:predicted nucleotide-binding protein (sugar kinase/HSP70/actin superfamily)